MMNARAVAVDIGASSGRILQGTLQGGTLCVAECHRFANSPVQLRSGQRLELMWDILALWNGVTEGLATAATLGPVDSVGVDTWGVDYGLLDEEGRLLANPACYRSDRTCQSIREMHDAIDSKAAYVATGTQHQPFNTVYQLLADRDYSWSHLAHRAALIPDLLGYWLTGNQVCEVTNASTTGLLDPSTRAWSAPFAELFSAEFGIDIPGLFAPLVEPGTLIGSVEPTGAAVNSGAGRPAALIAVGSHDTASAVVAIPAARYPAGQSFGFISSGTWSLAGVELDHPILSEASRAANFSNELGVDGTVRYLQNIAGLWVLQQCKSEWERREGTALSWDHLATMGRDAVPFRTLLDLGDARFLAPGDMTMRIDEVARERGEGIPRSRSEYVRAITESLAVAYRHALRQAAELGDVDLRVVHVVGGGVRNGLLCQLTANATALPVVAGPVEGTAIGNLLVQLRAIGEIHGDLPQLRCLVERSVDTITYLPQPSQEEAWARAEARVFSAE